MDVLVTVSTEWTGPNAFIITNTAQPVMGTTTTYISTAMVNSFGIDQSGVYTCTVAVSSTSWYIINSHSLAGSATIIAGKILQSIYVGIISWCQSTECIHM